MKILDEMNKPSGKFDEHEEEEHVQGMEVHVGY